MRLAANDQSSISFSSTSTLEHRPTGIVGLPQETETTLHRPQTFRRMEAPHSPRPGLLLVRVAEASSEVVPIPQVGALVGIKIAALAQTQIDASSHRLRDL